MLTSKQLNATVPYALQEELDWIANHTKSLPANSWVAMLGAGPGVFALAAVEGNPSINLVVIDHDTTQWTQLHLEAAGYSIGGYVHGDSAELGLLWSEDLNFLIVDADHSYEGVKRDIEHWQFNVDFGACVFFHDYLERPGGFDGAGDWKESGVARAVHELLDNNPYWEKVIEVGISVVYRKKL